MEGRNRKIIHVIHPDDNVGTAIERICRNEEVPVFNEWELKIAYQLKVITTIPKWYKVSITKIDEGETIKKFGYSIGIATTNIFPGTLVHLTHLIVDTSLDLIELMENGFELGIAKKIISKGDIVRIGENIIPTHPLISGTKNAHRRVGIAVTDIAQGSIIIIGNMMEIPLQLGWNERYARIVSEFYKLIRTGYVQMS
ncbi:MAG: hypothetical protein QXL15_04835 [Candidatus Korarchaeota archaeon]